MDSQVSFQVSVRQSLSRRVPIAWVQIGVIFALLGTLPFGRTVDPDFWWHLRTGKLIVESGIPRHDPFSWTAAGNDWVVHEWLSEALIYSAQLTLGYAGNVVLFGIVTLTGLALMYTLGRRLGAGTKPLLLLAVFVAIVLVRFVTVRPQVFTWLLVAVFVYTLERHDRGDQVKLWVLPVLMALWVNLHLGYVYGLAIISIWLVTRVYERARTGRGELRTPLLIGGACLLATLLNPSGPAILWYPIQYAFDGTVDRSLVSEWRRLDLTSPYSAPMLANIALLSLSLLSRSRPRPFLFLLAVSAIALSLMAIRHAPFVALLLFPVVGSAAAGRWGIASRAGDSRAAVPLPLAVGAITMVATWILVLGATLGSFSWRTPADDGYPVGGADYLAAQGREIRLFNDYNWGGYLIDRLYPDVPVFVDGRADFYGADILTDYARISKVEPGWETLLTQYGVDAAIIVRESDLASALRSDPAWQEAFTGSLESVFVRE